MDKTTDKIIFESRAEIGAVIHALEDWTEAHPGHKDFSTIHELIELLDAMEMSW